jgi:hypothetical protein
MLFTTRSIAISLELELWRADMDCISSDQFSSGILAGRQIETAVPIFTAIRNGSAKYRFQSSGSAAYLCLSFFQSGQP